MIPITLLYAPADREDLARKALTGNADVVILDLEDAVNTRNKPIAREKLSDLVAGAVGRAVQVRVNALDTPWAVEDLAAVNDLPGHVAIRVPKIQCPGDIERVIRLAPNRAVHALVETPLGIERAFDIAQTGISTIGLGEADLRSCLGVADADHLEWQRGRVINAAAAAQLPPPAMSVFADLHDSDGLFESTRRGAAHGFVGRAAIHPRQLDTIREAFTPTSATLERAHETLQRFSSASKTGSGTVVLDDGTFIDPAMLQAARRVLEVAEATQA